MIGLSSKIKSALNLTIEDIFDNIALSFIGNIPKLREKKRLVISSQPNLGLAHLFIQAMGNRTPNPIEQDVLQSLLESSYGYIDALKNKTKSNITERIDGLSREAGLRGVGMRPEDVRAAISEELFKAKSHMQAIAESESTKIRNLGTMMDISRVASGIGDSDPTVFFVVIKDQTTCKECIRLHLMPDHSTPRLWKFSELKQGYHKRGEDMASAFGLHPHCRCTLTYLSKGFGFNENGYVTYVGENHDAYSRQKK
jgi:hypothetical protein